MEVLEGQVTFSLDGKDSIVSAGDPPIVIKRGIIHGLSASRYRLDLTSLHFFAKSHLHLQMIISPLFLIPLFLIIVMI